jgi:hypothetical protein
VCALAIVTATLPVVPGSRATAAVPSGRLLGVWCAAPGDCVAVGASRAGATLVEQSDGNGWAIVASPTPRGAARALLRDVMCATAANCAAVGSSTAAGITRPLVLRRNAHGAWSLQATPRPTGSSLAELNDVWCVRADACTAVGGALGGGTFRPLVLRWNGSAWSIVPSPAPAGGGSLLGVRCLGPAWCVAVGLATAGDALAMKWNGSAWSIVPVPAPAGALAATLSDVRCADTTHCVAVGSYQRASGSHTLALRWDGGSWGIAPTPDPAGWVDGTLEGVACTSASSCTAVGSFRKYIPAEPRKTVAMRMQGAVWQISPQPNPPGASYRRLAGVACAAPASCVAVGEYQSGGISKTLVHQWNGRSWRIVPSPNPA